MHWLEPKNVGIRQAHENNEKEQNILYYQRQKNGKIESMERRLITTGLNGMVIEWDL